MASVARLTSYHSCRDTTLSTPERRALLCRLRSEKKKLMSLTEESREIIPK